MSRSDLCTDVLVVGSGAVGSMFARLLAQEGRRVTVVEAGKQLSARPGEHLKNTFRYQQNPNLFTTAIASQIEPVSTPQGFLPWLTARYRQNFENPDQKWLRNMPAAGVVYAVGGMLTLWTASTPDPAPFERAACIPDDDWRAMLLIAKRLLKVRTDVLADSHLGRAVRRELERKGVGVEQMAQAVEKVAFPYEGAPLIRWNGADTILGPLLDGPLPHGGSFQLLAEHRVEELCHTGGSVRHAVVRDLSTMTTFSISADTFIVAGGSLLTPRLLWQSGIRPYALGRYLNDNLEVSSTVIVNQSIIDAVREMPDNPSRSEPLPIAHSDPGPALCFAPTLEKPWRGQIRRGCRQVFYLPDADIRKQVHLTWYGTVDLSPDNRIVFSETLKDRFGMPQITIDMRYSTDDWLRCLRMWFDIARVSSAIGSYKTFWPMLPPPGSTQHVQGTCRIGESDQDSVADPYSRVWGLDNLYVGGLGAIPTSMASNPTLTACALAVRAAAHIRGLSLRELALEIDPSQDARQGETLVQPDAPSGLADLLPAGH